MEYNKTLQSWKNKELDAIDLINICNKIQIHYNLFIGSLGQNLGR